MNFIINNYNIFLIVLVCFVSSCIFTIISKKISYHINALDYPNERKIHKVPIPTLGGLGIFSAFLLGFILFCEPSPLMNSILISSFIIIILGIIDDINPLSAKIKICVQIIIATILVYYGNLLVTNLTFFGIDLHFGIFSSFVTIFFIVAVINAINLIDGLDGLASGISSIYFLTIAIIALILNNSAGLDIMLTVIMFGSTLGFLVFNFPPAKIFMGDTGSTFLGLMIAVVALLGFKNVTLTSLVIPLIILALPIMDTLFAILRRRLKGESIGHADKEHLHHQLLKLKFSPRKSLLIIYSISILFSITSILYILGDTKIMIFIYIILLFILIFIVLKTNIIFDKNKQKNK